MRRLPANVARERPGAFPFIDTPNDRCYNRLKHDRNTGD